jgi:hypothetical protein
MSWQSDMIGMMRKQGAVSNTPGLQMGRMTGESSCKTGDLDLSSADLYIPDRLLKPMAYEVDASIDKDHGFHDRTKYIEPLKAGDLVVLYRLSDTKYVILDRVAAG